TSPKQPAKSSAPTWSKVASSPTSKVPSPKSQAKRSKPKARRSSSTVHRPSSRITIPSHLQREIIALLMLVGAALFGLGLVSWSGGKQGVVGYMGGFLAQMFGVAAWLVPVGMGLVAAVLFVGGRASPRWLSPLLPIGLMMLLLGFMGF